MADDPHSHELLAPYALGVLDAHERARFERPREGCARCAAELPGLQSTAAALALDVDTAEPPPALRARIVAAAREDRSPGGVVVPLHRRFALPAAASLAAVAACAAVAVGIWAVGLSGRLGDERSARAAAERAAAILGDPTARRYPLHGAAGAVAVTSRREAALVTYRLARAPHGRTYELWIVDGSEPQPAGIFDSGGERSLVALDGRVPAGARVSISLEPAGGSTHLTGPILFGTDET